jgi:two-component system chemotaxis response regulator CheY
MSKTILVVDDSAVVRASVRFALEKAGYSVIEATDGTDGLGKLSQFSASGGRPAMILTDVNMPRMDGIRFIKEVKATPFRFVPILVLTTESENAKKMEGKEAGATGWLVKPFKDDQLLGVVQRFAK